MLIANNYVKGFCVSAESCRADGIIPVWHRRRRSRASPVLTAIGLAYGNPVYLTPHRIDVP